MREVGSPHDVVFADFVEQLDADTIALVGRIALPPPVVARLHLEIEILELVLPFEVHVVEDVGNPADATLAAHHSEPRMMFEYAGENDRHQGYRHIHLKARDGSREGGAANFVFELP